jgi:hypothetical protein
MTNIGGSLVANNLPGGKRGEIIRLKHWYA